MKAMKALMVVTVLGLVLAAPAVAEEVFQSCATRRLAGNWLFATEVGQQKILPGGDITAMGTMNFDRDGNLSGTFNVTVAEFQFFSDIAYSGSVTVNSDCRGTLTFITALGTVRTDSILVVSQTGIWGMSQDPSNLWTYRARRIPSYFR